MQPGYPGSGQDPYGQPQQPYSDPYAQPQPTSGNPYPTSGNPYPTSPGYVGGQPQYPVAPQYPVSGYGTPVGPQQNNIFGLLSMIFGIVSLVLALCCAFLSLPFNVAAVVLGILGLKRVSEGKASNRGMAMAGVICGGIAIVLMIANIAFGIYRVR